MLTFVSCLPEIFFLAKWHITYPIQVLVLSSQSCTLHCLDHNVYLSHVYVSIYGVYIIHVNVFIHLKFVISDLWSSSLQFTFFTQHCIFGLYSFYTYRCRLFMVTATWYTIKWIVKSAFLIPSDRNRLFLFLTIANYAAVNVLVHISPCTCRNFNCMYLEVRLLA